MPMLSRLFRRASQDGSTPVLENPRSASYPMCATCTYDPETGPEMSDLLTPPLEEVVFAFFGLFSLSTCTLVTSHSVKQNHLLDDFPDFCFATMTVSFL
jgi:hypothetical protein